MSELVPALCFLDVMGLLLRWRMFDHAAHLAGAGFGLFYTIYGIPLWSDFQRYLLRKNKRQ